MTAGYTTPLPTSHTVEEVAAALHEVPRYVRAKCHAREWPHCRGSRGRITFTDAQFAEILEIRARPAAEVAEPRWALAPRSRRAS